MLSEETVLDPLPLRIQVINDHISIARVTCCEDNHFEMLTQIPKNLSSVRPNVHSRLNYLARREFYG